MLDIKFIRENKEEIKKAIKNKRISLDLDKLLEVDDSRLLFLRQIEDLQAQKNKLNKEIEGADNKNEVIAKGKGIKEKLTEIEPRYKELKKQFDELMVKVPNLVSSDTPLGKDESDNVEIEKWGESPKIDFEPKDYVQLAKDLDIVDTERGAKVSGYRGYYLKNEGVMLAMALMMFTLERMISKGYKPMIPPTLVKGFALFGSGYFSGSEYNGEVDEIYQVATSDKEVSGEKSKEKKFLVGTAEPSLLAYYADEVLREEDLPKRICGFSQCYRSEIGSYGKDTKGFYRVHEFMKVEQVILCGADIEESVKLQDEMVKISKEIHQELGLPYHILSMCTGEMSPGKYRFFDIEVWLPGSKRWAETGSASDFLDWQARRLNVRYKDKEGKNKYVYMLNNTALATIRPLIAILENYQQADGSVKIPKVLRDYCGFKKIEKKEGTRLNN
ncbi:MAG: Serine-tRNA ligase [Parcubacteria group bacterium GW2011_GWA2_42_11]|nr:MAG: Serine-tRNA ligase [Parcubacteria group bacterium GW2011_GWA2_42_11]KKT76767.1 MAG: Serine-tRNA ligase [Parcubacteria group bacterium GW2011_GWF2_44_7]